MSNIAYTINGISNGSGYSDINYYSYNNSNWSSISTDNNITFSYTDTDIVDIDFNTTYPHNMMNTYTYKISNKNTSKNEIFPIGRRDEINKNRKREIKVSKYHDYIVKSNCYICNKPISKAPWNYDKNTFKFSCIECDRDDGFIYKNKSLTKRWYQSDKYNRRGGLILFTNDKYNFSDVPCISNNIEHEYVEDYPHNFNILDEYSIPLYKNSRYKEVDIDEPPYEKLVLKHALYYRGMKIRNGRDPLQPKGRVPQEYDDLFDNIKWRDSLNKRLEMMGSNI